MKKAYFKAFSFSVITLMAIQSDSILATAYQEEIRGDEINNFVDTYVDRCFSLRQHGSSSRNKIDSMKKRVTGKFNKNCPNCSFRTEKDTQYYRLLALYCKQGAINLEVQKAIKDLIEAEAWQYASDISGNGNTATRIAQEIGKEAMSLLNQNINGNGILDEFIGKRLKNKVTRYNNNILRSSRERIERDNEQRIKKFAYHYFDGSNETGNINAIIANAKEKAGSRNLTDAEINNLVLDEFKELTIATTRNKAKSIYTDRRTGQIVAKMEEQIGRRINFNDLRSGTLSCKTKGKLKDYLGQKLEGEIKSINRDLGR